MDGQIRDAICMQDILLDTEMRQKISSLLSPAVRCGVLIENNYWGTDRKQHEMRWQFAGLKLSPSCAGAECMPKRQFAVLPKERAGASSASEVKFVNVLFMCFFFKSRFRNLNLVTSYLCVFFQKSQL